MKARANDDSVIFWCPGCDGIHRVDQSWEFNGNESLPTFRPSVLVTYRHPKGHDNDNPVPQGWVGEYEDDICHSFVTDGQIEFLGDCTHDLAGTTVTLPELDDWLLAD